MSDLERTSSWNGLEIIEESDDVMAAKAQADGQNNTNTEQTPADGGDEPKENKPVRKLTPQEKRAERQKRRQHSRMIAFTVFFVVIALLILGGVFGYIAIGRKDKEEQPQAVVEEIPVIEEEKPVVEMTPEIVEEQTEEPTPEPEPEQTPEELLDEMVTNMIAEMTLEEKVAGLFIVTPESLTGQQAVTKAGDGTKEALEKYPVGGIVYFKQNITSSDQIKEMIENTKSYCRYPLFIAVDEEGGDVARIQQALKLDKTSTAKELGDENNTITTFDAYDTIGQRLTDYGFNLDFAPVADVLTNPDNKAIGDRAFSSDPDVVSNMVVSAIGGLHENDVVTCVKHFPGQGDADADTHKAIASSDRTRSDIENCELVPFKSAIENGVDMIMVGHLSVPELMQENPNLPCSLSKEIMTDLLRVNMEYKGVIITDSMSMAAISEYYGADEAAIKALKAGADMILMPEDFELAFNGVVDAVKDGTIDEHRINDSLARVYKIKYRDTLETAE